MITPDSSKKGKAVGADAQVSKPELSEVVRWADELISNAQREHRAESLHTIKSASMVIPFDPVTRHTHQTESLMENAREDRRQWPQEALEHYLEWLETLLSPSGDINAMSAAGPRPH